RVLPGRERRRSPEGVRGPADVPDHEARGCRDQRGVRRLRCRARRLRGPPWPILETLAVGPGRTSHRHRGMDMDSARETSDLWADVARSSTRIRGIASAVIFVVGPGSGELELGAATGIEGVPL